MSIKTYLVGGAVRDKLLGLPIKEQDWVVVGSTPEEMISNNYLKVGKDFPVFLHPKTREEYALARTERKSGKGYYGFVCEFSPSVTLVEDLSRRDFTINAIAEDTEGKLIDPYHGVRDIQDKVLRHVSPAFKEDPVRILRLARFASRFVPMGFTIAPETWELLSEMVDSGEVDELVPERVFKEMDRALSETDPRQFFLTLRECGALKRLWPSLDTLWGVPQPEQHHPEIDTGIHTMMALQIACQLSSDPVVRFATVCHDLGKGATPESQWPSHKGHEERGVPLIEAFCNQYRIPSEYRELSVLVSRYHLHCHKIFELRANTIIKLLESLDAYRKPDRLEKFILVCTADARGRLGLENREYPQADHLRELHTHSKVVDVKSLIDKGYDGAKLGERIHQERVNKLKFHLKEES
jgi:tRNA nucleotidyltransferase (CCA-adding enzyme)